MTAFVFRGAMIMIPTDLVPLAKLLNKRNLKSVKC